MSKRTRVKVALTISCPIEFKLLRSGERVIAQAGPDEVEAEFREDQPESDSWVAAIKKLAEESERSQRRELSKSRRALRRRGQNTTTDLGGANNGGGPEAR